MIALIVAVFCSGGAMVASLCSAAAQDVRGADATRGAYVFRKCTLCHVADPAAKDMLAPPLHNIMGRRAAQIKGFEYSPIMKQAGKKGMSWTSDALQYFLDRPDEFMPGTYMAFAGIEEDERRDVIAYLEKTTREFKSEAARRRASQTPPTQPAKQSKQTK